MRFVMLALLAGCSAVVPGADGGVVAAEADAGGAVTADGGMAYAPVVFTSALRGFGVTKIIDAAQKLHTQAQTRVTTGQLNKAIEAAYAVKRPRPYKGGVGKIFYGTQVEVAPPTFVLFVDDPARFEDSYTRYLENRFREMLPFPEVPMRINYKSRMRSASKNSLGPKPKEY